jgi:hypothetical protein
VFSDKVPVVFAIRFFKRLKTKETQKPPEVTMRQTRTDQVSLFDRFSNHDIGKELKAMSARLDRPHRGSDTAIGGLAYRGETLRRDLVVFRFWSRRKKPRHIENIQ